MKTIVLLFAFVLCVSHTSQSQSPSFNIKEIFPVDVSHSYIGFSVKYMGYAMVRGRFADFHGAVHYDEQDLTKTSVTFMIEVKSIDTGDKWRDDDLRSDNWFGEERYPRIYFVSRQTEVTLAGLLVTGDLTMRGITKTISIPMDRPVGVVRDVRRDSQVIFTGALAINRIEFGIEGKKWAGFVEGITAVSDDVNIELTILAKRINADNFKYWVANVTTPHGKIYSIVKSKGADRALMAFDSIRLESKDKKVDADALNTAGQMLLKENKVKEALVLFRKNAETFPEIPMVYESYGEALATSGEWDQAFKFYKTAVERDEWSVVAREVLRWMRK